MRRLRDTRYLWGLTREPPAQWPARYRPRVDPVWGQLQHAERAQIDKSLRNPALNTYTVDRGVRAIRANTYYIHIRRIGPIILTEVEVPLGPLPGTIAVNGQPL